MSKQGSVDLVSGRELDLGFEKIEFYAKNNTFKSTKIPTGLKHAEKISVSKEKRRIYLGGKGLSIFESKGEGNYEYEAKILDARIKSNHSH